MTRPRNGLDFRPKASPEVTGTLWLDARADDTVLIACDDLGLESWLDALERTLDSDDGGFSYRRVRLEHGGLRPLVTCCPWVFNRSEEAACIPPLGAGQPFFRATLQAMQRAVAILRRLREAPAVVVKWELLKLPARQRLTLYIRSRVESDADADTLPLVPDGCVLELAANLTPAETR